MKAPSSGLRLRHVSILELTCHANVDWGIQMDDDIGQAHLKHLKTSGNILKHLETSCHLLLMHFGEHELLLIPNSRDVMPFHKLILSWKLSAVNIFWVTPSGTAYFSSRPQRGSRPHPVPCLKRFIEKWSVGHGQIPTLRMSGTSTSCASSCQGLTKSSQKTWPGSNRRFQVKNKSLALYPIYQCCTVAMSHNAYCIGSSFRTLRFIATRFEQVMRWMAYLTIAVVHWCYILPSSEFRKKKKKQDPNDQKCLFRDNKNKLKYHKIQFQSFNQQLFQGHFMPKLDHPLCVPKNKK